MIILVYKVCVRIASHGIRLTNRQTSYNPGVDRRPADKQQDDVESHVAVYSGCWILTADPKNSRELILYWLGKRIRDVPF